MSILKDGSKLSEKEVIKTIVDKLQSKQDVHIFNNNLEYEKYVKQAEAVKGYKASDIGENDTYDLIMNDFKTYKRLLILANILKDKGLLGELSIQGGIVFSANDKVQEILQMLADKMSNPDISDGAFEKSAKEAILSTDIDERAKLDNLADRDRNGIRDMEEDINDNGEKDIDELIRKGERQRDLEIQQLRSTEEGRREQDRIARKYEKDREKEEKMHNRSLLSNILDD